MVDPAPAPQPSDSGQLPPVDPSSGSHPALPAAPAKVGTNWTLQDIFEWVVKGILGLAVFFVGAEYNDIKAKLNSAEDKIEVLEKLNEKLNAEKRLDTAEKSIKDLEKYKVVAETKDLTDTVKRIEGDLRDVSFKLVIIETRLGEVKDSLSGSSVRMGGHMIAPGPADSPH